MFELKYVLNAVVGTFHSYLKICELNETYSNQLYESLSIDCLARVFGCLGCFNCALSLMPVSAWRVVFSPSLLSAGLLESTTIVSTSHSSEIYVIFQFHPLILNIKCCTAICAHIIYCDALLCYDVLTKYCMVIGFS